MVTYKNLRNVVPSKEYANIYDYVVLKFSNCPIFPRCIKLQYEDEEVNDFIDLDSAIQLNQGKSNRINVLAEENRDTDSMEKSFFNTFSDFFQDVFPSGKQ